MVISQSLEKNNGRPGGLRGFLLNVASVDFVTESHRGEIVNLMAKSKRNQLM